MLPAYTTSSLTHSTGEYKGVRAGVRYASSYAFVRQGRASLLFQQALETYVPLRGLRDQQECTGAGRLVLHGQMCILAVAVEVHKVLRKHLIILLGSNTLCT